MKRKILQEGATGRGSHPYFTFLQLEPAHLCGITHPSYVHELRYKMIEAIFAFKEIRTEGLILSGNFTKSYTEGLRIPTQSPA